MPKAKPTNPRLVTRGDLVTTKDGHREEVVRHVSVVLHLADGTDEVYAADETVAVHARTRPVTEEQVAALEED